MSTLGFLQSTFGGTQSNLVQTLANLAGVLILSQILAWHYVRFAPVLSNKPKFARSFVYIAATTMLVITVVKTSLALSLGLVGALSIIRFRTPIKEPEELAYLFLAIGIGLGFGASDPTNSGTMTDLRLITSLVIVGILLYMGLLTQRGTRALAPHVIVHVVSAIKEGTGDAALRTLLAGVRDGVPSVDLRRVDTEGTNFEATLVLGMRDDAQVEELLARVQSTLPGAAVSVVDGGALD